jgi:hypothetical protein
MATAAPSGYNLAYGVTIVIEAIKSESFSKLADWLILLR